MCTRLFLVVMVFSVTFTVICTCFLYCGLSLLTFHNDRDSSKKVFFNYLTKTFVSILVDQLPFNSSFVYTTVMTPTDLSLSSLPT